MRITTQQVPILLLGLSAFADSALLSIWFSTIKYQSRKVARILSVKAGSQYFGL